MNQLLIFCVGGLVGILLYLIISRGVFGKDVSCDELEPVQMMDVGLTVYGGTKFTCRVIGMSMDGKRLIVTLLGFAHDITITRNEFMKID